MKWIIKTSFDFPPIPCRNVDWNATLDDYSGEDSDPIGRGATEIEAIADLIEQVRDAEPVVSPPVDLSLIGRAA